LVDPGELQQAAEEMQSRALANFDTARQEKRLCVEPDSLYLSWASVESLLWQKRPLALKLLAVVRPTDAAPPEGVLRHLAVFDNEGISVALRNARSLENPLLPLAEWVQERKAQGQDTVLACRSKVQAERLRALLEPYGVSAHLSLDWANIAVPAKRGHATVRICQGEIANGFVWPDECLALVTEREIFGARKKLRKPKRPDLPAQLLDFDDLKQGELVVHDDHGIGRYEGLVKLKIEGATSDFLLILYKDDDKLYLPVDRMNTVQKYRGVENIIPVLDKMGGKSWQRVKARVKKSTEKIAGELLKLYAARKVEKGFRFELRDDSLRTFETGFQYEETSDQTQAIEDVLADMGDPKPMDRLVCGDVGYGKTEVALRASYVAVYSGKQVAVLVPTTVLAEQHYATFAERFAPYGVNLACLSRFRSVAEQRRIIADLKAGKIDIVVGTHRLLQKDVGFKDLGLIVLDEEQRFGVRHKEKLKHLRQTVDVLALTATPIPRTLHLSLIGVRDISVISTPPEFRQAIVTYISEFDDAIVSEAIRRELTRRGQVFFVHNNIHSIEKIAQKIQKLVPEVRIGVAHGRQREDELERVMLAFVNKEIDLLVCTTIIESGLDIPSANTIIINRADRFGLAQIYQLRGRVGRSDEQAYAYLFIPGESIIGKDAQKRLKVLMEHSDLGSGFKIAMSDLQIRGGGTILGASQSGHVAAVGYDMFLKLMEESVAGLKGEDIQAPLEPEINMPLSAFIPETYVADIDQRLSAYRRLARMNALGEIAEFKKELIDRFGPLPQEAANLLLKIMVRTLAIKAAVKRLDLAGNQLTLYFSAEHQQAPERLVDMILEHPERYQVKPNLVLTARLAGGALTAQLAQVKNILKEIEQRVNN
jgi:transcription-repair coupling factor (superfamily II helicase)